MRHRVFQTKNLAMTVGELRGILETLPADKPIHLAFDNCTNLYAVHNEPGRYGRPGQVILSSLAEDDPDEAEDAA